MIPTHNTRTGAQTTVAAAMQAARWVAGGRLAPEEAKLHVIAPTSADVRDTCVEGPAGLVRCSPPWFRAHYEPNKRKISWPSGVEALLFLADEPERLRGPQCLFLWADELASWRFLDDVWDNAMFGLRLGPRPRAVITTTPRPGKRLRQILGQPTTVVTRGSTRDNIANLAPSAVERLYAEYGNTRLGRQELEAELLDDNPNALFKLADLDAARVAVAPELRRIVVAVDPAVSAKPQSDETGIVVGGVALCSCLGGSPQQHAFVLADLSGRYSPDQWARVVAGAYDRFRADRVVAEKNQGGDLVESTLRTLGDSKLAFKAVHATRGKSLRAEPIAALVEQRRVHLVGSFPYLEGQLTQWNPLADSWSPDRLDAFVYLLTELLVNGGRRTMMDAEW